LKILTELDSKHEGTDDALMCMIEGCKKSLESAGLDSLSAAVLRAVLHVADQLLQDRALLLPTVCHTFLNTYGVHHSGTIKSLSLSIDVGESTVQFSSRWLLNQLLFHLHPFMSHKCVHMRIGTIYRKGGNILASLSLALSQSESLDSNEEVASKPDNNAHKIDVVNEAACIINDLLHAEISRQSKGLQTN
jgi:hypothetical protein